MPNSIVAESAVIGFQLLVDSARTIYFQGRGANGRRLYPENVAASTATDKEPRTETGKRTAVEEESWTNVENRKK